MKRKGFTLIELLAVIVILAIISLIATPTILGVIEKARKGEAEQSALGYIDAIEKQIMINDTNNTNEVKDGTYLVEDIKSSYKGKGPTKGTVTIKKGSVKKAKLCINNYSFDFEGKMFSSINNYCSDNKVELIIDNNKQSKNLEKESKTTFEIDNIEEKSNIVCNNGAIPMLENNKLEIFNIYGNTTCTINNTLESAINNIDDTETNIVMINNEETNSSLIIAEDKNINLDLNGKTINVITDSDKPFITNNGNLYIYDSVGKGLMKTNYRLIRNVTGFLKISSGNYERINEHSGAGTIISNEGDYGSVIIDGGSFKGDKVWTIFATKGKIIINDAYIYSSDNYALVTYNTGEIIINNGTINTEKSAISVGTSAMPTGKLTINGGMINSNETTITNRKGEVSINSGILISRTSVVIRNVSSGNVNINQSDKPIYMSSKTTVNWAPVILNSENGIININANSADKCTDNFKDTQKGLCLYANGDGTTTPKGNCGIQNNKGTININGGTYFASHNTINNYSEGGVINIKGGNFLSNRVVFQAQIGGIINICEAKILSSDIDFYINPTGTNQKINYSKNVIFPNEANTPNVGGNIQNIFSNYIGAC